MPATDPTAFATDADLIQLYPVFADTEWEVYVTDDADDTYTVTVAGVAYDFVAVAETVTSIRDGLLAAMAAGSGVFTVVGVDGNAIMISGIVPGFSLNVTVSPATLQAQAAFTPAIRTCYLDLTECNFDEDTWDCFLWRGHILATVHWLKMWAQSKAVVTPGPSGQITSMTQGPFSIGFGFNTSGQSSSDTWWASTPEGQQYLALRDSLGSVAFGIQMGAACL